MMIAVAADNLAGYWNLAIESGGFKKIDTLRNISKSVLSNYLFIYLFWGENLFYV